MSAHVRLFYPGAHLAELDPVLSPFVLLELGDARVRPAIERPMTSFVHDELAHRDMIRDYEIDNRPRRVRCVHPLVTLLEKLDALTRRVHAEHVAPAKFVRHFEDAARVIAASTLPSLPDYAGVRALVEEMVSARQLAAFPDPNAPAFTPDASARWDAVRQAHRAIQPMFWGPRCSVEEACEAIRGWLRASL